MLSVLAVLLVSFASAEPSARNAFAKIALGEGEDRSFETRMQAVRSLPTSLTAADAEALFEGIILPTQPQGLSLAKWAALYNDVFNAFNAMTGPLENYPERLIALVMEEARPAILRDYALQHLLAHVEFKLGAEAREKVLKEIQPLALEAVDTRLPGTYLLGIWKLAGKPGYPNKEAICEAAFKIASNAETATENRVSAIQICGQLGYAPALEASISLAQDKAMPVALRSASLATIGLLGDAKHRTLLRKIKYTGSSDPRILYAVDSALDKLP